MNNPAVKHRPLIRQSARVLIPYLSVIAMMGILTSIFLVIEDVSVRRGLFVVSVLFGLGISGLYASSFEAAQRKQVLDQLARRSSLTCRVGSPLLGSPIYLTGTHRGRVVTLYHDRPGRFQLDSTRIELIIENPARASFRLRGPIQQSKASAGDDVTNSMISAAGLRQVGHEKQFLVGGSPVHMTTNLFSFGKLQDSLQRLTRSVSIELDKEILYFEHPGLLTDAEYLTGILNLLADLACALEQRSGARLRMLSAGV